MKLDVLEIKLEVAVSLVQSDAGELCTITLGTTFSRIVVTFQYRLISRSSSNLTKSWSESKLIESDAAAVNRRLIGWLLQDKPKL